MFFRVNTDQGNNAAGRRLGNAVLRMLAATAAFAVVLIAPVTIDLGDGDQDLIAPNEANARHGGGNGRGGNGRGGNGRAGKGRGGGLSQNNGPTAQQPERNSDPIVLNPITEPTVTLAVFTTVIRKRYPGDEITELDDPHNAVSFFTALRAMAGMRVTHRWVYKGKVRYQAEFDVMADSWRIWSTQLLPVDSPGEWTVEVVDAAGNILATGNLMYRTNAPGQLAENDPAPEKIASPPDELTALIQRAWGVMNPSWEE
jgi:hypothetical protein